VPISCVYCGLTHDRPDEVKECWQRARGAEVAGANRTDPAPFAAAESAADPRPSAPVTRVRAALLRGPDSLGRNVIVGADQPAPDEWAGCERIVVGANELATPEPLLARLRAAATGAAALVIELNVDFADCPALSTNEAAYELGPRFFFPLDEVHHLVWSNAIDARGEPRWELVDRAVALGASVSDGTTGDVVGPDGVLRWLDGGPVRHHDPLLGIPVVHAVAVEHGSLAAPAANVSPAELAPDQLAAVTHVGGAARIIAPAGSGKTRVLTERARHLLTAWNLPPSAVTLVAFNKRAQVEMSERTCDLRGLQIQTFNALALAIVNGRAPFAPQSRRLRTLDEPDVRRIIAKLVTVPKRRNVDPIAPWIDALSLLRLGLVSPTEVEARYNGDVDGLVDVWPQYRKALDREAALDFDDQIYRAIDVLLTQPAARAAAQRACRVLLVDEFQDLTPAHLLLVRLLGAPGGAVFGVGDDDQTIYGYNGADPGSLIDFATLFPGAGDHPLEVNYRCPGGVVAAAGMLVRHNRRRVAKTIRASSDRTDGYTVTSSDDPVAASVELVEQAIADGTPPAHIAVLTRVNATIAPVQVALTGRSVPITGGVGAEFADRTAIRAVLAWLRLASARRFIDNDVVEALRRPSRPLHPRITDWVAEQNTVEDLHKLAERLNNDRDTDRVHSFAADIDRLRTMAAKGASTFRIVSTLVDQMDLAGSVATLDNSRHGMNRSAQSDDLQAILQLASLHTDAATFEAWLRSQLVTKRDPAGVQLSTVHRVKGLEWPLVVVHLADTDQFPHRLADDTEEERRLFHVAITRASDHAAIVTGTHPSPFVAELTTEPPEHLPEEVTRSSRTTTVVRKSAAADHPLLDRTVVMAVPGLVLVDQGTEWTITDIEPEAALATNGAATRRFGLGDAVETLGRQRGALAGRHGDVDEHAVRVFDEMRAFRNDVRGTKPAYTVFDDKTLVAIASARPESLVELARVKGVGPAKLEQYGDAVLAIVAGE
jgi:DNA helicase-2/ATP-dependent DNA helicase PcrA